VRHHRRREMFIIQKNKVISITKLVSFFLLFQQLKSGSALPGIVETIAGGGKVHHGKKNVCNDIENSKDGIGEDARFNYPWGIAYNFHKDVVYVADCGCVDSEHRTDLIREIDLRTREVKTIAGSTQGFSNGYGKDAHFKHIAGISLDPELSLLYIADSGNHRIRVLYIANNKVETVAGLPIAGFVDSAVETSQFNNPQSVAVHRNDNGQRLLYVADTDNHAIRVIYLDSDNSGDVKTVAGGKAKGFKDGRHTEAAFNFPTEIVIDGVGRYMYVADLYNHAIRRIEISSGIVMTLSESGFASGMTKYATFHYPEGLVYDPDFQLLYVCEFENHDIRVVTMEGTVKTLAGALKGKQDGVGKLAKFFHPSGLAFNRKHRMLYVADQYNHLIRSVSAIGSDKIYKPDSLKKFRKIYKNKPRRTLNQWIFIVAIGSAILFFIGLVVRPCYKKGFALYHGDTSQTVFRYTNL